ncbi:MAG: hypothetical protein AB8B64_17865 [Granulosicoccus sp.]
MNLPNYSVARILVSLAGLLVWPGKHANATECGDDAILLEQAFGSGAAWSLCAHVDEHHALEITAVHYRTPGGISRSVIKQAHVGQILLHYHDETEPRAQINDDSQSRVLAMNANNCDGLPLLDNDSVMTLCSRLHDNRILAKYAQRPGLQSQRWELSSAFQREGLVWAISLSLTEDGQITPAVTLSGRAREKLAGIAFTTTLPASRRNLARATVLANWRVVFDLDTDAYDQVQQFDFVLNSSLGNRRPMQVIDLNTELFTTVDRNNFRGWRISDPEGGSYYLDPSNSGFNFGGYAHNWAKFDVALTRYKPCERHASNNTPSSNEISTVPCGNSLDEFVNGENLQDAHPVLWFSQSRTFNPTNEDWPVISNFYQSFTLLPYDWTPSSPFEVVE